MPAVYTRKDVRKLADWDPILLWYARAIADMKNRRFADPASWRYQAAIHDYDLMSDPLADPGDPPPSSSEQRRFWKQCQHFSWFFLPWHRMYLTYFEQIVRASVVRLGGPNDWALPYWNYSDAADAHARCLPSAFTARNLPDGTANALRVEYRDLGNDGGEVATPRQVDLRVCLRAPSFEAARVGSDPGFGGPATGFNHSSGRVGSLEGTPHGSMHVAVGGWMGSFNTAGLDPLFWLHHCNIDRLWEVWLRRDSGHANPTDTNWGTAVSFDFHDGAGAVASLNPTQVIDSTASPLLYKYEDVSDPLGPHAGPLSEAPRRFGLKDRAIPEMVGATENPITLRGQPATTSLTVTPPTGPARITAEAGTGQRRTYLNLENITGEGKPVSYSVYLNVPPGENPADHEELFVGILPMFGVAEATQADANHPGGGLHYTLEISDVVRTLESAKAWDPNDLRVTFVPETLRVAREVAAVASPIHVGRVSLYSE